MLNASLYGVLLEARESGAVGAVYGAIGGSEGILKERFLNLSRFPEEELKKLLTTPGTISDMCFLTGETARWTPAESW